jgi:flagellar basal-body rod protein FlgB
MEFLFKDVNLQKYFLDFLDAENHAHISNIANAETPFYKKLKVELLNKEDEIPLKTTNPKHITNKPSNPFAYKVVQDKTGLIGYDQNNVSVEKEMVGLEKVALKYETVLRFIRDKITKLDLVIKGTGGGA